MTPAEFRAAREALSMSTADLAKALTDPDHSEPPVHERTIRRWEHGERPIPHPVVIAVKHLASGR